LRYVRWRYRFGPEELLSFLVKLGLRNGDVVLTHISYDRFSAFTGKPTDVIDCLQRVVGNQGTLLMPTIPFTGLAVEYVREGKIFDVLRTPSQMGLVTEIFRRMPGVVRSVHPTHPVAAWGARAQEMISGHENCSTPCGRQSPYGRLLDCEGKILLLGTGIRALTFFHPDISRKRNIDKLVPALKRRNALRRDTLETVEGILLEAREVLDVLLLMAEGGQYCYDP
jgi:aminoglycoside 3-N-acetyltransferase